MVSQYQKSLTMFTSDYLDSFNKKDLALFLKQNKKIIDDQLAWVAILKYSPDENLINYDLNDPIAAQYRGYYFNGATSIINLPPYGSYTTPVIYLAPVVTIDA